MNHCPNFNYRSFRLSVQRDLLSSGRSPGSIRYWANLHSIQYPDLILINYVLENRAKIPDCDIQPSKGPISTLDPAQKRYLYCCSSLFFSLVVFSTPSSILLQFLCRCLLFRYLSPSVLIHIFRRRLCCRYLAPSILLPLPPPPLLPLPTPNYAPTTLPPPPLVPLPTTYHAPTPLPPPPLVPLPTPYHAPTPPPLPLVPLPTPYHAPTPLSAAAASAATDAKKKN